MLKVLKNDVGSVNVNKKLCLNGEWQFRQSGNENWLPANVPGCNFTDLLKNNLITDPFNRNEEHELQWIEEHNWEYRKFFDVQQETLSYSDVELVMDGLDTYCDVFLNNQLIFQNNNMFVGHRVSCKEWLCIGNNELRIEFRSPINEVMPTYLNNGFTYPAENDKSEERLSVFTRKAPYHYGWDWGPRFVTSGIWRDIALEAIDKARIDDIYVQQLSLSDDEAILLFQVSLTNFDGLEGYLSLHCQNVSGIDCEIPFKAHSSEPMIEFSATIHNPKKWWPNGLGDAFLHHFSVTLAAQDVTLHSKQLQIGLRTIEVINQPDSDGESFFVKVNGYPTFMKGANYIPSDSFLDRVHAKKYRSVLEDAVSANMNMLRVWGGGIYEDDEFYRLADQQGILIWQDFMFACSLYPGDTDFIENVKKEVKYNIKRLRNHACIALWCGNNETEMGIEFWQWQNTFNYSDKLYQQLKNDYDVLFKQVLPEMVLTLDPARFYFSSSPIGFWENKADDNRGDNHYWGVWHGEEPFSEFKNRIPRFMSEFGFQSFPIMASVKEYSIEEDWYLESSVMKTHQKHPRGNALIRQYMESEYREPKDFESFLYLSQVQQALGMKIAFEAHRSAMPFCMGSLYWQFNDCWPVASWSGIDYYGRWKAMHYQVRRCFEPIAVFIEQTKTELLVNIVSDSLTTSLLTFSQKLMALDGSILWESCSIVEIKGLECQKVMTHKLPLLLDEVNNNQVVFVSSLLNDNGLVSEAFHYFTPTKELKLQRPNYQVSTIEKVDSIEFVIQVDTLARQVHLSFEDNENNFSDNFFDLLPNTEKRISLPIDKTKSFRTNKEREELKIMSIVDTYLN